MIIPVKVTSPVTSYHQVTEAHGTDANYKIITNWRRKSSHNQRKGENSVLFCEKEKKNSVSLQKLNILFIYIMLKVS